MGRSGVKYVHMGEVPTLIIIFGITGDLAKRKLLPALYHLMRDNLLHPDTQIIGVTRQKLTKKDVLATLDTYVASHARPSPAALRRFRQAFHVLPMDLASVHGYRDLKRYLAELEQNNPRPYRRLYYLSIPPAVFDEVVEFMGAAGLQEPAGLAKLPPALLVEKPFGYDLDSAQVLIRATRRYFAEAQIYRIDHYLAKEMAQNILDFRFRNPLFASVWNNHHISQVVITAHEQLGIENRAGFYEQTGALRDLIQSHLLQLLGLVAMEPPRIMDSAHVHGRRLQLLKDVALPEPYEVAAVAWRAQYEGYRREVKRLRSNTETYARLRLAVNNPRWQDVPFILQTGKALDKKETKIELYFGEDTTAQNILTLHLQPEEGVNLGVYIKAPGHGHEQADADMRFVYKQAFSSRSTPDAYERVLLDAINADHSLFATSKEVLAAWRIVQPVLDEWVKSVKDLRRYPKGAAPQTIFPQ